MPDKTIPPAEAIERLKEWRDHGRRDPVGYNAGTAAFGADVLALLAHVEDLQRERAGWSAAVGIVKDELAAAAQKIRQEQAARFGVLARLLALREAADYVRRDLNMRAHAQAAILGREPVAAIATGDIRGMVFPFAATMLVIFFGGSDEG